jgi:hypothetical protein
MAKVVGRCPIAMPVIASLIVVAIVLVSTPASAVLPDCNSDSGVDFQMSTDRRVYLPGALMHVRFTVTNTSETPLYLIRSLDTCGSELGAFALSILDRRNRRWSKMDCSATVLIDRLDVVEVLTNPKKTILLRNEEIFGREQTVEVPDKRGTYTLEAKLLGPMFNQAQREILAEKRMRILDCHVLAPTLKIEVK